MGNTSSHGVEEVKHSSKLLSRRQSNCSDDHTRKVCIFQDQHQLDQSLRSIRLSNSHSFTIRSDCDLDKFNGYGFSMQPVPSLGFHVEHHNFTVEQWHLYHHSHCKRRRSHKSSNHKNAGGRLQHLSQSSNTEYSK